MRPKRIVIYGGTDLPGPATRWVKHLVRAILAYPDTVIVTGGIVEAPGKEEGTMPTDVAVTRAAEEYLGERGIAVRDRLESWVPDPEEDERWDLVRDWARAARTFHGYTAEGRRFALVLETDAIITFKGEVHTATVLELALLAGKPALPMPFTGGDSEHYWKKHRARFQSRFKGADDLFRALDSASLDAVDEQAMEALAKQIAEALARALERWCLVLMPFGEWGPEAFFEYVAKPVIEQSGFQVERLDQSVRAGHIPQMFLERLDRADAVVADLSDANPNVMYEIGHVHGRKTTPFLYSRRAGEQPLSEPPFYFRPETIYLVDPADKEGTSGFRAALGDYLEEVIRRGMPCWPSDSALSVQPRSRLSRIE